jgi:hypothetical protein
MFSLYGSRSCRPTNFGSWHITAIETTAEGLPLYGVMAPGGKPAPSRIACEVLDNM